MSRIVCILEIDGGTLWPYHGGPAQVVIEESGGKHWIRNRYDPEVNATEEIEIAEGYMDGDGEPVDAVVLRVVDP